MPSPPELPRRRKQEERSSWTTVLLVAEWTHESAVPWSLIVQLDSNGEMIVTFVVMNVDIFGVKLLFFHSKITPSKYSTAQKINKNNQQKSSTMA